MSANGEPAAQVAEIPQQFALQLAPNGVVVKSNPRTRRLMVEFHLINGVAVVEMAADADAKNWIDALVAAHKKAQSGIEIARGFKGVAGS